MDPDSDSAADAPAGQQTRGGARGRWATLAAAVGGVAVLVWQARSYLPFVSDDALISLRYARRLLDGHGLTWTDAERVEGYSNLLWVLATAAVGAAGVDLISAARILGIAGMSAALIAVLAAFPPRDLRSSVAGPAGALVIALAGPIGVWAVGGLEQPLVAALLAWAVCGALPYAQAGRAGDAGPAPSAALPGACLALLCLTRPDGALLAVMVAAGVLAARSGRFEALGRRGEAPSAETPAPGVRPALRAAGWLLLAPAVATAAQLCFRLAYYGDHLPNPARAKVAFSLHRVQEGWAYLTAGVSGLREIFLLAALGLVAAALDPRRRRPAAVIAAPALAWAAYVIMIGGDIFPGRRHIVPLVVLAAFLAALGLDWLCRLPRRLAPAAAAAAAAGLLAFFHVSRDRDGDYRRARWELWEWDGEVIGRLLGRAFGDKRPLLGADAAGCIPYFSRLPSIDLLGLNDRRIARRRPPGFGSGYLGHELGDGVDVLSRDPDLLVFCGPAGAPGGCFRSGHEMVAQPRFRRDYDLVTFEGREPHRFTSAVWVRREGGPISVARAPGKVEIPGFFLAASRAAIARLDDEGRIGAALSPGLPAHTWIEIDPGLWRVDVVSSGAPVALRVACAGLTVAEGAPPLSIPGDELGCDDAWIEAMAEGGTAHVRAILLAAASPGAPER